MNPTPQTLLLDDASHDGDRDVIRRHPPLKKETPHMIALNSARSRLTEALELVASDPEQAACLATDAGSTLDLRAATEADATGRPRPQPHEPFSVVRVKRPAEDLLRDALAAIDRDDAHAAYVCTWQAVMLLVAQARPDLVRRARRTPRAGVALAPTCSNAPV